MLADGADLCYHSSLCGLGCLLQVFAGYYRDESSDIRIMQSMPM